MHSEGYCSRPVCVTCVSVRSFLPPRGSRSRNIGTYGFTAPRKKGLSSRFSLKILRSEAMASFACLKCHQLHLSPKRRIPTESARRGHAILTKMLRSEVTVHLLTFFEDISAI